MYCCQMMDEVLEQFPLPFYRPVVINSTTLNLEVASMGVTLYKKGKAGNPIKTGHTVVFLNYCPWCGKKLREIQDATPTVVP